MSQETVEGPALDVPPLSTAFFDEDPGRMAAFAHPVRMKIMRLAQGRELSAKEASELLGEPIGKVSYHVRVLDDAGFLELVRQTPRRGAIESFYRARVTLDIDDDTWRSAGPELRRPVMLSTLQAWLADMAHAIGDGGFDPEGTCMGNAHFCADAEGLAELRAAFDDYYARLHEIEARIAERRERDPGTAVTPVNVGFAFHGGARSGGRHGPFFVERTGALRRLIPEELPGGDGADG